MTPPPTTNYAIQNAQRKSFTAIVLALSRAL